MKSKQIISIILTFAIMTSAFCFMSVPANAKSKNITASMKKKKGVKKLVKRLSVYCIGHSLGRKGKNVIIKNTNKKRLSIASYVRYHFNNDNDYTRGELRNTVKNLFGKKVKAFECSEFLMENTYDFYDGEFTYAGGDFGNMSPKYQIDKISKNGKFYTVRVTGKIHNSYDQKTNKQCKITIKIKKSSKSSYGYIATSLKYKKCKSGQ